MGWGGFVDPNLGGRRVGRSSAGLPGGGGGTPTYIPQNDLHDALIILNIHKWGLNIFQKKIAHQLRLPSAKIQPGGGVGGRTPFFVFFSHFSILHKILSILGIYLGQTEKFPYAQNKISSAPGAHKTYCSVEPFCGCTPPPPPGGRVPAGSRPRGPMYIHAARKPLALSNLSNLRFS